MSERVRLLLLLTIGALALGWGLWAVRQSDGSESLESAARADAERAAPPGLEPRRRSNADPRRDEAEAGRDGPDAAPTAEGRALKPEAAGLAVALRVIVRDRKGEPWPENSGSLTLSLERQGREPLAREIELIDGFARLVVDDDIEVISIDGAQIGAEKRGAEATENAHVLRRDFADGDGDVTLTLLPRVLLRVLDALDRRELHEVVIVRAEGGGWGNMRRFDLDHQRLVARGDSPLAVSVREHGTHNPYWVLAAGHAAGLLHFDAETEGERVLQLEAGGSLDLELAGDIAGISRELEPWLRLRRFENATDGQEPASLRKGPAFCEEALGPLRTARVEYLPAGLIEVSLELGDSWAPTATLAKGRVEIAAGASAKLRLVLSAQALSLQPAKASGFIEVPADGLEGRTVSIHVSPADPKDKKLTRHAYATAFPLEDEATRCRFVDIELFPGRYVAVIEGEEFPFELPAEGRSDLRFALPAREVVEVVLRNAGEEQALTSANVSWSSAAGNGEAFWDAARKAYLCTPPTGELRISAWTVQGSIDVAVVRAPGQTRLEVELPKPQNLKLVLRAKGLIIPHEFDLDVDIRDQDDQRVFITSMFSDGAQVIRKLDLPGVYTVKLRTPPAGYQAGPAVRFEVKAGETREVVIELEPLR